MVGRLITTKHHERLIKIFSKLEKQDWKLVIVGGDAKRQQNKKKLEQLVHSLQLNEKVFLVGNQKDVASFYKKSKIFAFTSSSEGFPNVIGEAMSAGLPVIAYDCMAGPSEIIKDGEDGYLIPLFDDELFQNKLEFLMTNEKQRNKMGEAAIRNTQRFDAVKISEFFSQTILARN